MAYHELWNVLWNWRREFSVREFKSTFPSPSPNKVLHDLMEKGFLERTGWGRYRVNSPKEYLVERFNVRKAYELVEEVGIDYAFTGPDAVFFWTKGGYNVGRFFGFYPIHLKVKREELGGWSRFFKSERRKFHINGEPVRKSLFGSFYTLYPEPRFRSVNVKGFRVTPLEETLRFCRERIYAYQPALEMLDETYGLGLKVKYREEKTGFR